MSEPRLNPAPHKTGFAGIAGLFSRAWDDWFAHIYEFMKRHTHGPSAEYTVDPTDNDNPTLPTNNSATSSQIDHFGLANIGVKKHTTLDRRYNADVYVSDHGTLAEALTFIGSSEKSLTIDIDCDLSGVSTAIPASCDVIQIINEAIISNGTLTINKMSADPRHRIFDSDLTVFFNDGAVSHTRPEWFGAVCQTVESDNDEAVALLNSQAITLAISSLPGETGGRVEISGFHFISIPVTVPDIVQQNLDIVGVYGYYGTATIRPSNAFVGSALFDFGGGDEQIARFTIRGVTFDGMSLDGVKQSIAGISITNATNFSIKDCVFSRTEYGVKLTSANVFEISGNQFGSNCVYGIWGDIVNDIRVIGNDMQEGRGTNMVDSIPANTNAIYFNRCGVRSLVNNNKINAWYGVGIELNAFSAEEQPEIVISGNHISETEGGIKVSEDGGTLIVGNMITNDRNDRQDNNAIQCVADNVSIKSNHIVLFGKGIISQAANITITGNDIYDCGRGIDLAGATENKVTANNVVDRRGSPSMDYGVIERASADDNEIFLNSFVNAQTSAALITGTGTRYGLNRNYDYERFTDTGYTVQHNENGDLYQQTSTVSTSGDNDIFSFFAGATDANISQRFRVTNGDDSVTNMRLRAEPGATASDSYFEIDANARVSGTARIDGVETTLSGIIRKTTRITQANSPYTMTSANHVLVCDTDGGAITVYLPVGVEGTEYTIKNVGSSGNAVTIDPDGAETIFGASSELVYDGEVFDIVFDSTEGWR